MGQAFYEIDSNFLPVYNLAVALIKERGRDDICRVLLDARLSVLNTEFDGWNGGTYGYTVFVSLSVKQYTSFSTEKREEMEKVLSDALNESIKGDNNNYFHVQIGPFLSKDDVDWNLIGGLNGKATLKQDVETIRNIMISVATGGNRIQDEDKRYKELHIRAQRNCKKLNLIYIIHIPLCGIGMGNGRRSLLLIKNEGIIFVIFLSLRYLILKKRGIIIQ